MSKRSASNSQVCKRQTVRDCEFHKTAISNGFNVFLIETECQFAVKLSEFVIVVRFFFSFVSFLCVGICFYFESNFPAQFMRSNEDGILISSKKQVVHWTFSKNQLERWTLTYVYYAIMFECVHFVYMNMNMNMSMNMNADALICCCSCKRLKQWI